MELILPACCQLLLTLRRCHSKSVTHNNSKSFSNAITNPFSNAIAHPIAHALSNAITHPFSNAIAHPFAHALSSALTHPFAHPISNALANPDGHAHSNSHQVTHSDADPNSNPDQIPHSNANPESHPHTHPQSYPNSYTQTHAYNHTITHVIPSPTPTPKTMLNAALYLQGPNVWPLSTDKLIVMVKAFADTMTTIQASDVNILNIAKAVATRRLLQRAVSDTAAVVQVQMTGKSENQTDLIAQELGTVISNTKLQASLYQKGLELTRLKVLSTTTSVPLATSGTCSQGSITGVCIGTSTASLSKTTIIILAVCIGGGVILLLLLVAVVLMCWSRKKQRDQRKADAAKATPKAMTPSAAYPYYETKPMQFRGVKVRAEPPRGSAYPPAYSPHAPQEPDQAPGPSSSQHTTVRRANPATFQAAPPRDVIVDGDEYMEYIEMGGRTAREQLRMKLPTFGAAAAPRRTDSLLNEAIKNPAAAASTLEPTPEEPADEKKAADKGKQPKRE
ncbi:hypothetical protein COCSUDRAFT_47556 [Coccomyxa subellipsoidea C-169]|uniref:Uncharacterized protein n=1 Tax=Coccomyxa subellipsoidea (strain C-169) TaxID=574566 RepID=I0YXW6_COCSC|nr:hypothetical protein COCSUDRAFT_47556 [Coccomyxa subellipsoidea C-169]EIE23235.1 hypothetical protein COCSUDRAFT_47556 [Coccomyxa subellipsoidea C-169]|eukprot:XP_005647779.1 hypothetical protein COCSUDRAFT_47556 [Coccomyxa subellipsoidea C-169]